MAGTYYNRFAPENRYKKHRVMSARGAQSSEINEIQDSLNYEFKTVTDITHPDGTLLRGGDLTETENSDEYRLGSGTFWAQGFTHALEELTFSVGPTEDCVLGVALAEEVITAMEDPTLRDPAVGTRNFDQEGADRTRYTARWTKDTDLEAGEDFYSIHQFIDGLLKTAPVQSGGNAFLDTVARYDYRSNGNYIIDGLTLSYISTDNVANPPKYKCSIAQGSANVEGFEQTFPFAIGYDLDVPTATRAVANEPVTFTADGDYATRYNLIATVVSAVGNKRHVQTNLTKGVGGGTDGPLVNTPVATIVAVNRGGTWNGTSFTGGTNYTMTTDWVQSGDSISWAPAGVEPSPGELYTVVYDYVSTTVPAITSDKKKLTLTGYVAGQTVLLTYNHYLPRYDVLVLRRDGQFEVVKGQPSHLNPQVPQPAFGLPLATCYLSNGADPVISNSGLRVVLMSDFHAMRQQLADMQYNIAQLSLNTQLTRLDPSTTKKGIFTDPMTSNVFRDAGQTNTGLMTTSGLIQNVNWTNSLLNVPNPICGPTFTQVQELTQPIYTLDDIDFPGGEAWLTIGGQPNPLPLTPQLGVTSYRWVINDPVLTQSRPWWYDTYTNPTTPPTPDLNPVIMPQVGPFNVTCEGFTAGESVVITFDGIPMATVNADGQGTVSTNVTTPLNALSGTRQIKLVGQTSAKTGCAAFVGMPYYAPASISYPVYNGTVDPLAQTFTPTTDHFIASIDVVFTSALPTGMQVDCLLCRTTGGNPDPNLIFGHKRLKSTEVISSPSGTNWTRFTFEKPLLVRAGTEYAAVFATNHNGLKMRQACVGAYDPVNGRYLAQNTYALGSFMQSSDFSAWKIKPSRDMTMRINRAQYATSTTVSLGTVAVTAATDLCLMAGVNTPLGTSAVFTATLPGAGGITYQLAPYVPVHIPAYTGNVNVSVTFTTTDQRLAATVDPDATLAWGAVQSSGIYTSRASTITGAANQKLYLEIYEPNANAVTVEFRNAADSAWVAYTRDSANQVNLGNGWVDMPFVNTGGATGMTSTRFRITVSSADPLLRPAARNLRQFFS